MRPLRKSAAQDTNQRVLTPIRPSLIDEHVYVMRQVSARHVGQLDSSTVDALLAFGRSQSPRRARTFPLYRETRKSLAADVVWEELSESLKASLGNTFATLNDAYSFALCRDAPEMNLLRYAPTDYFDWHLDVGGTAERCRKLVFSIQLTDSAKYEGGALEIFNGETFLASRERGSICVFPAFLPHRVTTVTSGARFALVGWFYGPALR